MRGRVEAGDAVQTPLGKGVVREVRNGGRLLVDVAGRAVEIKAADVSLVAARPSARAEGARTERGSSRDRASRSVPSEIDLHGLTVEQALTRAEDALNDAMLADVSLVRFIHGRSGGRIRAALHAKLRAIPSVRRFLVDPRNEGVTIVEL